MARAAVDRMLADPIGNDFPIGDRVHLAFLIGLKMHAAMPAPIEGDRIDAVIAFALVYGVHHRIGVRPGRGRKAGFGQKRWADDHVVTVCGCILSWASSRSPAVAAS